MNLSISLPSSGIHERLFGHSFHLVGNRLQQLVARFQFQTFNFSGRNVEVRAYEGPTSYSVHQHPDDKKLMSGDWINFATFQGVFQIQCWISDCWFIGVTYKWELVTKITPGFWPNFDRSKSLEISFPSETWCLPNNNLVYCSFSLYNFAELNLRIDFVEVTFSNTRRDKIRNEIIRSKTGVIDIIEKVKCMKGQWAGHVARMKNTRWAKITSEWTPRDGKRLRGRPKRRWRDDIEEAVGSQWMRTAKDRSAWRKLWRPSASSGMNG